MTDEYMDREFFYSIAQREEDDHWCICKWYKRPKQLPGMCIIIKDTKTANMKKAIIQLEEMAREKGWIKI